MKQYQFFIGVDVSKETLDYAVVRDGEQLQYLQTPNSTAGVKTFLRALKKLGATAQDSIFCLEHTGIYCNHILSYLTTLGIAIWMESPTQIKRSLGIQRGKNDKVDAQRIALFAFRTKDAIKLWQPPRKELLKLKHLMSARNRILKTIGILSKVFSEKSFYEEEFVQITKVATKESLQALRHDLANVDHALDEIIKADEELHHLYNLVTSVHGIGRITAIQIIVSTNEFKNISDPKKFACYCGVAPFEHSSGTSVRGKTRVSKMADMNLKKCLHMAALSVVHYKGELQDFFNRKVAEGKNKMSVINAVRNKLIHRVFACVRDDRPYLNNYFNKAA